MAYTEEGVRNIVKHTMELVMKSHCFQCGHCCVLLPIVSLTREEIDSGKYIMRKEKSDGNTILQRRSKYIPELKRMKGVCIYYNPRTRLCEIHDHKPSVCIKMSCEGTKLLSGSGIRSYKQLIEKR